MGGEKDSGDGGMGEKIEDGLPVQHRLLFREFVDLREHQQVGNPVEFQPAEHGQVIFAGIPPDVQNEDNQSQGGSPLEISFDHGAPFFFHGQRHLQRKPVD